MVRRLCLLVSLAAALAIASGVTRPATAAPTLKVWFVFGEQLAAVDRPGTSAEDAIRALLLGPTQEELGRGYRTYVPSGTPLRSVEVVNGMAIVDLGERFVAGRDAASLVARLSQVVYTLSGVEGVKKVKLLVKGGTPLGIFPGVVTAYPLSVADLKTPKPAPALRPRRLDRRRPRPDDDPADGSHVQ
jgi:hypothetical protein